MSPATMDAKSDSSSTLRRYFDPAVAEFQTFTLFMNDITSHGLHSFWGARSSTHLAYGLVRITRTLT